MLIQRTTANFFQLVCALLLLALPAGARAQELKQTLPQQRQINDDRMLRGSNVADAYYHLGVENLGEPSNSDRAIENLEKAVELDRMNPEYHYMLAEAYMSNFQYAGLVRMPFIAPKVKAQLELAVQFCPRSSLYREALIQYYVFAPAIFGGSYRKAHQQADEIAAIDPYLGMLAHAGVYSEEGEDEKAQTLFRKAMHVRPAAWQAYQRLGALYLSNQEIDEAIKMFKKYVEVAPDHADSHNQLGQAYQQKRMYDDAIAAFERALQLDPSLTPLVFRIAQLHEFKGNKGLARVHYQRYLSMVPSGRAADDARVKIRELGH
jgi:tetratricopeptide (TPR) repeat protein